MAFLACPRFEDVLAVFASAKDQLAEILSAFEFLVRMVYFKLIDQLNSRAGSPCVGAFAETHPWCTRYCFFQKLRNADVRAQSRCNRQRHFTCWWRRPVPTLSTTHRYAFTHPIWCNPLFAEIDEILGKAVHIGNDLRRHDCAEHWGGEGLVGVAGGGQLIA